MQLTLQEADQAIADWRGKLTAATDNLLALDGMITYKRLEGKDGLPPAQLTGVTAARVTPALEALRDLFGQMSHLTDVVDRAMTLRKTISRFRSAEPTLQQIDQLLNGASIELPAIQTPIAQRSLLTVSQTSAAMTPNALLQAMTRTFEGARDAVLAVDAAWSRLEPAVAGLVVELNAVQQIAVTMGVTQVAELLDATRLMKDLTTRIQADPLGVSSDLDRDVRPLISRARTRLAEEAQARAQVRAEMNRARTAFAELEPLRQQAEAALAECRAAIAAPSGLKAPPDAASIAELGGWLDTLEASYRSGTWQPVRVGLARWWSTAQQYLDAAHDACTANRAPIELCAELQGRLSALMVKAQARGVAQDPPLGGIASQATALLRQRPTPVDKAAELVAAYEAQLARRIGA